MRAHHILELFAPLRDRHELDGHFERQCLRAEKRERFVYDRMMEYYASPATYLEWRNSMEIGEHNEADIDAIHLAFINEDECEAGRIEHKLFKDYCNWLAEKDVDDEVYP